MRSHLVLEASQRNESSQFRTLHVQECMQVMLERDGHSEPLDRVAPVEICRKRKADSTKQQRSKKECHLLCTQHVYF